MGAGLIQVKEIARGVNQVANLVARGIGGTTSDYPFALALILYFLICGFILAYLWTRLYLPDAFAEAEKSPREILEDMSFVTDNAEQRLIAYSHEYERLRRSMPSGSARTVEMTGVVTEIRALARELGYDPQRVNGLFDEGTDGARIAALALARELRQPETVSKVIEAIASSRSAFEQYQALKAAEAMFGALSAEQVDRLIRTIRDQRSGGPGKYITRRSDRWAVSDSILAMADAGTDARWED